jgi:hypothetical protein
MFGSCCYHSLQLLFVHYVGGSQGLRGRGLAAIEYRSMGLGPGGERMVIIARRASGVVR